MVTKTDKLLLKGNRMCEICICENPLTSEEIKEYERIISNYKGNKLRNYIWSKLTAREHIRFIHYLVIINDRMKEVKMFTIY